MTHRFSHHSIPVVKGVAIGGCLLELRSKRNSMTLTSFSTLLQGSNIWFKKKKKSLIYACKVEEEKKKERKIHVFLTILLNRLERQKAGRRHATQKQTPTSPDSKRHKK